MPEAVSCVAFRMSTDKARNTQIKRGKVIEKNTNHLPEGFRSSILKRDPAPPASLYCELNPLSLQAGYFCYSTAVTANWPNSFRCSVAHAFAASFNDPMERATSSRSRVEARQDPALQHSHWSSLRLRAAIRRWLPREYEVEHDRTSL